MASVEIVAQPYNELPLKTAKQASLCEELHLGSRDITHLGEDFTYFKNLECLWLNDNLLSDIDGLEANFRIKHLYLHGNKIKHVYDDSFAHFIAIETLSLRDNQLDDFDSVIRAIKPIKTLTNLELAGNFISKEDNYKLRCIGEFPNLKVFDRHTISLEEREEARQLLEKLAKLSNFSLDENGYVKKKVISDEEIAENKKHQEILAHIHHLIAESRITFDKKFLEFDKRKIGCVDSAVFWEVLRQFRVEAQLNEQEIGIINRRYSKLAVLRAMSETGTISKKMMNYRKFCFDTTPTELLTIVPYKYKMEMCPEVSVATADLNRYVHTVTVRREQEETLRRKQTMLAASTAVGSEGTADSSSQSRSNVNKGGLKPWMASELSKLLKGGGNSDCTAPQVEELSRRQIENVLKEMRNFGKVLTTESYEALQQIYVDELGYDEDAEDDEGEEGADEEDPSSPGATLSYARLAEMMDCQRGAAAMAGNSTGEAAAASSSSSSSRPTSARLASATGPSGPVVLKWRDLSDVELRSQEASLFAASQALYELLIRAGSPEETAAIQKKLVAAGVSATRLNASKRRVAEEKKALLPHEVIAAAGNRSDIVVLPNIMDYDSEKNAAASIGLTQNLSMANSKAGGGKNKYTLKSAASLSSGSLLGGTGPSCRTPYYESRASKLPDIAVGGGATGAMLIAAAAAASSSNSSNSSNKGQEPPVFDKSSGTIPSNTLNYKKGWNEATKSIVLS